MVRAILEGRKTKTRRIVKDHEIERLSDRHEFANSGQHHLSEKETPGYAYVVRRGDSVPVGIPCPHGKPGDRLWVRETWSYSDRRACDKEIFYKATDGNVKQRTLSFSTREQRWRPPIYMFREDSRINLEITDIRVERLQDITEEDAKAEGCLPVIHEDGAVDCGTRKTNFAKLWESINGPDSWDANPFIWVISFKRVEHQS